MHRSMAWSRRESSGPASSGVVGLAALEGLDSAVCLQAGESSPPVDLFPSGDNQRSDTQGEEALGAA